MATSPVFGTFSEFDSHADTPDEYCERLEVYNRAYNSIRVERYEFTLNRVYAKADRFGCFFKRCEVRQYRVSSPTQGNIVNVTDAKT